MTAFHQLLAKGLLKPGGAHHWLIRLDISDINFKMERAEVPESSRTMGFAQPAPPAGALLGLGNILETEHPVLSCLPFLLACRCLNTETKWSELKIIALGWWEGK